MADLPETDELVLITVKKILPYGAFCTLNEYKNVEGFLHISEVAPRWIKNIHEFLHEGQNLVARVYRVDLEKEQIDLSLKRVSDAERKRKLEDVRRTKRGEKLFEQVIKNAKIGEKEAADIRARLIAKHGDLLTAIETISATGEVAAADLKIPKRIFATLSEIAQKNIKKPKAEVKCILTLTSYAPNGIERIHDALAGIPRQEGAEFSWTYLGAPRYQLNIIAEDYKTAERVASDLSAHLTELAKKVDGTASLERLKT